MKNIVIETWLNSKKSLFRSFSGGSLKPEKSISRLSFLPDIEGGEDIYDTLSDDENIYDEEIPDQNVPRSNSFDLYDDLEPDQPADENIYDEELKPTVDL